MKALDLQLEDYLNFRRGFGYDLSTSARVLRRFVEFSKTQGVDHITSDLFLSWKEHFGSANNNTWSARLGMVRSFASWLQGIDPRTEVPPSSLIIGKVFRPRPYIYSAKQISDLVKSASQLPSPYGLRGWTYATFFGLIAVSGMRISEAIALKDIDVDLDRELLVIKRAKNGQERIIPLSESTAERLRNYRGERDRILGEREDAFFRLDTGRRLNDCTARYTFAKLSREIALRKATLFHRHGHGPRIHDLRHTFAVRTMLDWFRKGLDPDQEMLKLTTYLGHRIPEHTYWYIEAVPELLQLASERAERSLEGGRA
jgi:integrase